MISLRIIFWNSFGPGNVQIDISFDNFVSAVLPFPNDHILPALRLHLWPRHHHHPQHDPCRRQVPRHAQQRQGVHGAQRGDNVDVF